jgi:hypothetical protein
MSYWLEDDAKRTMSDLLVPEELEVAVAESSARHTQNVTRVDGFERAGRRLKAFKLLRDDASRREALPPAGDLKDSVAWPIKRLRVLAIQCGLNPSRLLMRGGLIRLVGEFREEPEDLDLGEAPPLQSADLGALQSALPCNQ